MIQRFCFGLGTTLLRFLPSYPGQQSGRLPSSSTAQLPQRSEVRQSLGPPRNLEIGNLPRPEMSYKTLDEPALPLTSDVLSSRTGESD